MLNIEKYKDIVLDNLNVCSTDARLRRKNVKGYCEGFNCVGCTERFLKWLLEEAKEPILDDAEKKYLSAVIKPFLSKIKYIAKFKSACSEDKQYIHIGFYEGDGLTFPYFKENSMYKGMELNKAYTLKELRLC